MADVAPGSGPAAPVLLVAFKRLDELREVAAEVAAQHDGQILVFVDAARPNVPGEESAVAAVRGWVAEWAASLGRVTTHFPERNHGVAYGVPAAIDWAFAQGHESLIILEDDCLPSPDFFPYAQELLSHYRDDERIMGISGDSFTPDNMWNEIDASYAFVRSSSIWGWATWRRAWAQYDHSMAAVDDRHVRNNRVGIVGGWGQGAAWWWRIWRRERHDPVYRTWDGRWQFAVMVQNGLFVVPRRNLVRNIGFGAQASNSKNPSRYVIVPRRRLEHPLRHPGHVFAWTAADRWVHRHVNSMAPWSRLRRLLTRVDPSTVRDEL